MEHNKDAVDVNAQAKTAILNFLSELNVSKIIYVDDRCSIAELKEPFIGTLKSLYSSKRGDLDFVNWDLPYSIFENEITDTWEDANEERKRQLFFEVLKCDNKSEHLENSAAPLKLKEILNDKIDLLSPTQWVSQKDVIIRELNINSKVLFLFDIDFKFAPLMDGRNGKDLVSDLLSNTYIQDFVYCGIFSHLFSIEEEYAKRNAYCKSLSLDKNKFYTISKKRFQDNLYLPGLAEGIKNTLLINEVELLKTKTATIIKKSFRLTLRDIKELTPETFNHIIQKSSEKEGIWEMDTLLRLTNIINSDKALNSLLPEHQRLIVNQSLSKIRNLEKNETGSKTPYSKIQIQKIREKELYFKKEILNQLHFPICNGDIFLINNKEYILLGQPCNLALRNNGKRSRDYDIGFLVELKSKTKEDINKCNGYFERIEGIYLESDKLRIADLPSFQTVSLIPLDLTAFNIDGIAKINLSTIEIETLTFQESWKKRYKKLHKEFTNYKKGINTFLKPENSNNIYLKELVLYGDLFKGYHINNNNILTNTSNELVFKIQRISHYKQPYSTDLLQKFMQYLSRNAFDHDYSKD
jgi:hypothetical protein